MTKLQHRFIKTVPEKLEDGILYVSVDYATVIHKCCCGCGGEVVTPLSPTDWKLTFDGTSISLSPSIGNWNFKCQSHYWINNNCVEWAPKWSKTRVTYRRKLENQERDQAFKIEPKKDFSFKKIFGRKKRSK